MPTAADLLAIAQEHHQAGRLQAAEEAYRQVLLLNPRHVQATNLLGVLAGQQGDNARAESYFAQAVSIEPHRIDFHLNLGQACLGLGKLAEAADAFRRAAALNPDSADSYFLIGTALRQQGQLAEAVTNFRRAVSLQPGRAAAHRNLGSAVREQGELAEAVACYQRAIELEPNRASTYEDLGVTLVALGRPADAIASFWQATQLAPKRSSAHNSLGNALCDAGRLDEAIAAYRRALELTPDRVEVLNNLGSALKDQGHLTEAIECLTRAVELNPEFAEALNNLGCAWEAQGQLAEAADCFRRAMRLHPRYYNSLFDLATSFQSQGKFSQAAASLEHVLEHHPDIAEAHNNLGNALKGQGRVAEAIERYQQTVALEPQLPVAHSNLLATMHYQSGITLAELIEAHREYESQHAAPLRSVWRPHNNSRDPDRRLRIGFVSPDLHRHPVAGFSIRALEHLDRDEFEIACYHNHARHDEFTARFKAIASIWREAVAQDDQQLADQIRADGVDILVDLTGHTANNRLLAFARKPAPIQITWIGYEGTTGLAAMDYLVADPYVVAPGTERYYSENVLRLPETYVCYDPPATTLDVGAVPALDKGYVTFASFNNLAKINSDVIAVWSAILRRIPQSRLMLKYYGLNDDVVKRRFLELFVAHGIEPHRLDLAPPCSYDQYLAAYQQIDIGLDPFPFSGGVTTCESLWMGVPVITWPRELFASRHSLSYLSNIGLTEMVASGREDYIERAAALASDLPRLAAIRAGLRDRMTGSPFCNGQRFAKNLATLLRHIWRQWCREGKGPE